MPAHAPGNVPVEITLNGFDHTFSEAAYHYEAMISTLGPIPTRVLAEGGGEITLSLWPSEDTDMSLVCIVDTFPVPASKLSAGTFLCMTPPRAPGFVALDMAIEDSDILSLHPTVLEYQIMPTVTGLNPVIGIDSGVSVIKVSGRHMVGNEAFCHVGYDSQVQAEFVSSVLVKCEAPAHEPSRVVIEISTSDHGEQFSHNDIIYEYIEEGAVVAIVPREGSQSGGTVVRLAMSTLDVGTASFLTCKFGTIAPLRSRAAGLGVECASPAHKSGLISVAASVNSEVWSTSELAFEYMSSATVFAIAPASGPVSGGTVVHVMGSSLVGENVLCRFGLEVVAGEYIGGDELCTSEINSAVLPANATGLSTMTQRSEQCMGWVEVACMAPPHAAGIVTVEVSATDGGFSTSKVEFEFQPSATVVSLQPASGPSAGVGVVKVVGEHLVSTEPLCGFGLADPSYAEVVSSVLAKCEAPAHETGMVSVEMSISGAGQQFTQSGMMYSYTEEAAVVAISPREGAQSGGTVVRLALSSVDADVSGCRFGTIGPLSSRAAGGGAECASPAHEGGMVAISASVNSEVWSTSELAFEYMSSATVFAIAPASGPVSGGTVVHVMGSSLVGENVLCRFGLEVVAGEYIGGDELCTSEINSAVLPANATGLSTMTQRSEQCMGWVEVACMAPPHAAGIVTVEVSATDGGFSTSKVEFEFQPSATVVSLQPASGPSAGVGVVKVVGEHLVSTEPLCGFGLADPSYAEVVSSVLAKCEAPAHETGMVSVEMSISGAGQQFTQSGMMYSYTEEAAVVAISPREGAQSGGTVVRLALSSVDADVSGCRFGTIGPLSSRAAGGGAECASPAHEGGMVAISASVNSEVWSTSELAFEYMSSATVFAIAPASGPVSGGTVVHVMGSSLVGENVLCRFGLEVVAGEYIGGDELCTSEINSAVLPANATGLSTMTQRSEQCMGWVEVACMAPPHAAGIVTVEVSATDGGFSTSKVEFEFQPSATVVSLQPASGPSAGVGVVKVVGEHLVSTEPLCGFGLADPSYAEVVSSVLAKCEAPAHETGMVSVEMSISGAGQQFTQSGMMYSYTEEAAVVAISPREGAQSGGTVVRLALSSVDADVSGCRFGTIGPLSSRAAGGGAECASPAHEGGMVAISASVNSEVWSTSELAFEYMSSATVFAIAPASGPVSGGTVVHVMGSSLVGENVLCRFGLEVVAGEYIGGDELCTSEINSAVLPANATGLSTMTQRSEQCMGWVEVACMAPPHAAGIVTVEVSATDGGFSTSKVEFEFQPSATVVSLQPASGPSAGVGVVKVVGEHLVSTEPLCGFGLADPSYAEVVSSVLAKCEAPAHETGMVSVEMSISGAGQQFTQSGMMYSYTEEAAVVAISPREGAQSGGTVVRLALSSVDADVSGCRFGTIGPLSSRAAGGGAECASPAHEGGMVAISASVNSEVWSTSELAFEYMSSATVFAIAPASGPVSGGTVVHVMGSSLVGENVLCRFGLEVVAGEYIGGDELCTSEINSAVLPANATGLSTMTQRSEQCMGWVEVACMAPPHAAGIVTVEVSATDGGFSTSKVEFEFQPSATVVSLQPASGPSAGVGVVKVVGEHLVSTEPLCGFGLADPSYAEVVSSVLAKCEAPAHETGMVSVELLSSHGQQLTDNQVAFSFYDDVFASSMFPSEGYGTGGTVIEITFTDNAPKDVSCYFGSVFPVHGRPSRATMACVSPTMTPPRGVIPVGAAYLHSVALSDPLVYDVIPTPKLETLFPAATSSLGGTTITIVASPFMDTARAFCRFGDQVTVATKAEMAYLGLGVEADFFEFSVANATAWSNQAFDVLHARPIMPVIFTCETPRNSPGFVSVEVGMKSADGSEFDMAPTGHLVDFAFEAIPSVAYATPSFGISAGGSLVRIVGSHFSDAGRACGFGSASPTLSTFVSSALMVCESPAHEEGTIKIELALDDAWETWTTDSAQFQFMERASVFAIDPPNTVETGGNVVNLHGTGFASDAIDSCAFGTVGPTPSRVVSSRLLECVSPASEPQRALRVAGSGRNSQFSTDTFASVHVANTPKIEFAYPTRGPSTGGTRVAVVGSGLASLRTHEFVGSCAFGEKTSPADWLNIDELRSPEEVSVARAHALDHINSTDTWRTLGVAMGWSMVICESTPSSPGFVPLGFRTDIGADVAEISFTFTPSALVSIVHPGIITDDPAWVIHAEGFDFPIDEGPAETGYVSCTFGSVDSATAAIFVSSAYIKCEAPSHMLPGLTQLNLVTDQGLRWTQDSSSVLDVLPSVRAIAVEPPTGWAEGGVSLEVHVGSLPVIVAENSLFPPFACQFGTIAPVASRATSTSMMCTTPAAVPGWRRVSVTPGINLMTGGDGPAPTFHVLPIPEVIAAAPLFGPTAGGNRVTFTGLGTLTLGNVACMFDGEVKEARAISATDVECTVPAHEPGVIQVSIVHSAFADGIGPHGLAVALGSPLTVFDSGTVDFEYFGIFHMVHHYPRRSPTMGGTMLNLYGDGFTRRDHSYRCMFGSGYFQDAEVVSSSIIRCAAPPRRLSGEALLTMTLDVHDSQIVGGEEEGRTGMHSFYWQPKLYSFDPDEAKSNGGQEIVLRGDDFIDVDTLSCRFGTVQVAAAFYSEDRIMCKAPARSPSFSGVLANKGQNTLEISANAFDYTTTGLVINYLPSADDANSGRQISALEALGLIYGYTLITEVLVTNGPVTGGTPAVIDGANFDSQDVSCKFMSTQTSAIWVNSFRIICMTPPQPAGFAALELLDGSETTNFGNQFHFHPRVKVSLLEPTFASTRGGELVMVNGKHFMQFAELGEMPYKVGTFCSLGTLAVEPAHFISSALVICETLEHQKADLALEISLNTMDKSFSRIQLHLRDHPSIDAIEPYGAPAVGGAVITVSGGPFDRDVPYGCKIGTLGHVAGFLLSPSQTACVLPSHVPGFVPLYVTQNWHDVSEAAVTFQYREPAVVDAVMPAHGLTQGGDLITVTGAHFKQGEQPYCRMGHQLVATDAVTPNAIVCYTPAMPPGFIRIGVADGFEDGIPDNMDQGKGAWFLFQPPAVTMAANPFVGGPGGGSLVTVTGYELVAFEPEGMLCHFGGDEPTNAYLISSVLARCESSAHAEGVVALELSATGPIQGLEYASFEYVNSPRPVALDPPAGPSEGGARLVLTLVGAEHWTVGSGTQGASVQFGTVWPLSIRSLGGGGVELFAPARTPSVAPLLITTDLSSSSPAFNGLKYNSYGLDSEVRVLATYPERSISSGGSLVDVTVAKRGEADEHVPRFCHFGLDSTPAHFVNSWEVCLSGGNAYLPALNTTLSGSFYEGPIDTLTSSSEVNVTSQFAKWASSPSAPTTSEPSAWFAELGRGGQCLGFTTVRCIAPAQAAGWTQVTVGDPHTPPSGTGGVPFEYLAAPVLFLSQPADGGMGGGSVARITGSHLHGADACWSGTDVVDAHVVSSSLVYCETPGARDAWASYVRFGRRRTSDGRCRSRIYLQGGFRAVVSDADWWFERRRGAADHHLAS